MSTFHALSLKIMTIEPFDPELVDGYDDYELPAGYKTIDGKLIPHDNSRLQLITIMVSPGRIAKCPVDAEAMDFVEDQEVKLVMGGTKVVSIANIEEKKFVFFNSPLRKKYVMPRVMMGINMAMVVAVAGYILGLIVKNQQFKIGIIIVEGVSVLLFVSSIIYSIYYFSNDSEAHTKLRQYLKKLLK